MPEKYDEIVALMRELSVDMEDGESVLCCYMLALYNLCHQQDSGLYWSETEANDKDLLPFDFDGPLPEYVHDQRFMTLCEAVQESSLYFDAEDFFRYFTPWMISQWGVMDSIIEERKVWEVAALVYLIVAETRRLELDFDQIGEKHIGEIYRKHESFFLSLHLTEETFKSVWKAVYYIPMPKLRQKKASEKLTKTAQFYRENMINGLALIQDYCQYNRHATELAGDVNPWVGYRSRIKKQNSRSGVTIAEKAFNRIRDISFEHPADVVRAALYPYPALFGKSAGVKVEDNYDRVFECSFFYREFKALLKDRTKVLIVNPGPDFLLKCSKLPQQFVGLTLTVAVTDSLLATAYRTQFKRMEFCVISELEQKAQQFDLVALVSPVSVIVDQVIDFPTVMACCGLGGRVLALLPQTVLTQEEGLWSSVLRNSLCKPEQIIEITSDATMTSPKKKMLLYADAAIEEESRSAIPVYYTQCSKGAENLVIEKRCMRIELETLYSSRKALKTLRKQYEKEKEKSKDKKSRKKAEVYSFSDEIKLQYTIHKDRYDTYVGEVYYKSLSRKNNQGRCNRDSKETQRGLRNKSLQKVLEKLEDTAYYDLVEPYIISDIKAEYGDNIRHCSLKTIWFCARQTLLRDSAYDDEKARFVLFSGSNPDLASIHPEMAVDDDYRNAMRSVIPEDSKAVVSYWRQLNLIMRTAVRLGFLRKNPMAHLMDEISRKASKELRDLRNALTKKTFTPEEERRIFAYLCEKVKTPFASGKVKRYVAESIWLLGPIRLFTGISLREACALMWGDLEKLDGLDGYQLLIYKFLDDKGTCSFLLDSESSKFSYRKVPLAPILAEMLLERRTFMMDILGYSEKKLKETPIVLAHECMCDESREASFCKYTLAVKRCRQIIDAAQIPTQQLVLPGKKPLIVDMNKYNGDIFYSNFRHRANHICAFSRGELSYVLGNKGPDTYSQHYCDYSNDMIQYMMAQKLRRWTWKYEVSEELPALEIKSNRPGNVVTASTGGQHNCLELTIYGDGNPEGSYADVKITSKHGVTGTVMVYPKEDNA